MKNLYITTLPTLSKAQCVTLAVNGLNTIDGANALIAISREAVGTASLGNIVAQDSTPIQEFTPKYLSTAVQGCKAAVQCLTTNESLVLGEFSDYSVIRVDTHSFIYGTLNFTKLDNGYTSQYDRQLSFAIWS